MTVLVTGGAGFIGSNFVIDWLDNYKETVINLDKLTYAGNLNNLNSLKGNSYHIFIKGDICNRNLLNEIFDNYKPRVVINFAAESHVDRSIVAPKAFIKTNIIGTYNLIENVKSYWENLDTTKKENFRFLHISTDEVYGSLSECAKPFTEVNRYEPNSPYGASKASSDHLVRAYHQTYGLPVLTTNCSNNYGPYQFPEKLIPLVISNALEQKEIPIYGDGLQIRDWLYVKDHCSAIRLVLERGIVGEVYNIGGLNEKTNIEVVEKICEILDFLQPLSDNNKIKSYKELITHIKDRKGHDRRYAIDSTKIQKELNWSPTETFEDGIKKTVNWYINNKSWLDKVIKLKRKIHKKKRINENTSFRF